MPNITPIGMVSHPHLFTARAYDKDSEERYTVSLVWGPDVDLSTMKKTIGEFALDAFNLKTLPKQNPLKLGIRSTDVRCNEDGSYKEGYPEGGHFADFWRKGEHGPAALVGPRKGPDGYIPLMEEELYAGMFGRVIFNMSKFDRQGNRGVSLHVESFQKTGDGKKIAGRAVDPNEGFEEIPEEELETADKSQPWD